MSRLRVLLITMVFPALAGPALAQVPYGDNTEAGHYLQVGDARIYYERYGKGPPVLLLHGGLFGSIGEFADVIQDLQRDHSVIAMALRGSRTFRAGKWIAFPPAHGRRCGRDITAGGNRTG